MSDDLAGEFVRAHRALVGHMPHAGAFFLGHPREHRREVVGQCRDRTLIRGEPQRLLAVRELYDRRDDVRAVAADPRRAHNEVVRAEHAFTGQFRRAVFADRIGRVALGIGRLARAVEDVVGRHVHDPGTECGHPSGELRVRVHRLFRISFATVDIGPRRAMEHDIGVDAIQVMTVDPDCVGQHS